MMKRRILSIFIFSLLAALCLCGAAAAEGNPFSDIPQGHWAYDAAAELAAQGVISGYNASSFGGGRLITRYELASILARSLAKFDESKATEEQLKLVRMMTAELRDELDALGVKAEDTGKRVSLLEDRVGGWSLSGSMQFDAKFGLNSSENDHENKNDFRLARMRLNLMRRFGENGDSFFLAQFDSRRATDYASGNYTGDYKLHLSKAYVNFALPGEWRMSAGLFSVDYETYGMMYATGSLGEYSQGAWITDVNKDALAFSRSFANGYFNAYVYNHEQYAASDDNSMGISALASFQFNEKFALDVAADYRNVDKPSSTLDSVTTVWVAPKYQFTPSIALKGAYYAQFTNYTENEANDPATSPQAWRVILDVKQDLLKFTSLWLEYDHLDRNFVMLSGADSLLLTDRDNRDFFTSSNLLGDLSIWRVGLNQTWNSKLSTWLYYASYRFSDYPVLTNSGLTYLEPGMDEISAGVEYKLTNSVAFSLGYFYHKYNDDAQLDKERILRFRTTVRF